MRFSPMPLATIREPFNDPDWLFEPKWDGFGARAYINDHSCQLAKHTGLVCPACRAPVAVVENRTPTALIFWCPGCGNRWSGRRTTDA